MSLDSVELLPKASVKLSLIITGMEETCDELKSKVSIGSEKTE